MRKKNTIEAECGDGG